MWHWNNADESNLFDAKFRHLACLLKNFKREFPFFKIFSKINLPPNVCSRSTPRYRTDFFVEIFVSPHLISKDGELQIFLHDPNKIDSVLPRCKERLLSTSQLLKAQSSFPSVSCMTWTSFPETNKAESSGIWYLVKHVRPPARKADWRLPGRTTYPSAPIWATPLGHKKGVSSTWY